VGLRLHSHDLSFSFSAYLLSLSLSQRPYLLEHSSTSFPFFFPVCISICLIGFCLGNTPYNYFPYTNLSLWLALFLVRVLIQLGECMMKEIVLLIFWQFFADPAAKVHSLELASSELHHARKGPCTSSTLFLLCPCLLTAPEPPPPHHQNSQHPHRPRPIRHARPKGPIDRAAGQGSQRPTQLTPRPETSKELALGEEGIAGRGRGGVIVIAFEGSETCEAVHYGGAGEG